MHTDDKQLCDSHNTAVDLGASELSCQPWATSALVAKLWQIPVRLFCVPLHSFIDTGT